MTPTEREKLEALAREMDHHTELTGQIAFATYAREIRDILSQVEPEPAKPEWGEKPTEPGLYWQAWFSPTRGWVLNHSKPFDIVYPENYRTSPDIRYLSFPLYERPPLPTEPPEGHVNR